MSPTSSKMSIESSYALQAYGRAMYQYAIAYWISLGLVLIMFFASMGMMFQNVEYFLGDMSSGSSGMVGFAVGQLIISVLSTASSIYMLVRYIQYLLRLKSAAEIVGDPNLQDHYKNELRVIIVGVVIFIVSLIMVFSFFQGMLANLSDMGTEYSSELESSMISLLMRIFLWILILGAFGILSLIFSILSVIKLDDWAEGLLHQYGPNMGAIKEGTNLVKWGRIAAVIPIVNYIAPIIMLVGYTKAGKAIKSQFGDGDGNIDVLNAMGSSLETSYLPSETFRPVDESRMCRFCGAPLPTQEAGFCAMCGKKLR